MEIYLASTFRHPMRLWCFHLGLRGNYEAGRGMAFIQMAFAGGISCIGYFAFTYVFHLPQTLLHLDFAVLFKKRKRG